MWIVFHDPNTIFTHLDKYITAVVEDDDILTYQQQLAGEKGIQFEISTTALYIQQFVRSADDKDYFVRKYIPLRFNA